MRKICASLVSVLLLSACGQAWNDPYPASDAGRNILYTAFTDRPKHLDPAQSYTEDEATFTAQIYEPPLQYHYLKRPYELIPATGVIEWARARSARLLLLDDSHRLGAHVDTTARAFAELLQSL